MWKLIRETGFQAQENHGYLELIILRRLAVVFSKEREGGRREEVKTSSSISSLHGKTLSILVG